jgi:putative copper export protein
MLGCAAVIVITRSASGHAADLGDMTFPELMDWLHLMAVSAWGGGLLALSAVILTTAVTSSNQGRVLIADLARRFSTLAGIALGTLVVTAMYNGWLQVGSFHALWNNTGASKNSV